MPFAKSSGNQLFDPNFEFPFFAISVGISALFFLHQSIPQLNQRAKLSPKIAVNGIRQILCILHHYFIDYF